MVEVAMAFAESVIQKMVFLSSDVQTFLVDAFCERVATKAFAEMERPAIEMVVDLPFFRAQTRGTELMGLHLRKQVVKISSGRGAGEGCHESCNPAHTPRLLLRSLPPFISGAISAP